jgi:uncharacterized protein (DUF1015 family)
MMYLTDMNDPGLTILPSHRLIKTYPAFERDPFLDKIKTWFEIDETSLPAEKSAHGYRALEKVLTDKGRRNTAVAFCHRGNSRCYLLTLKAGARNDMGVDLHPSLKQLDVLVLSRFIFQRGLGFSKNDLDNEEIFHYESSMGTAISQVETGDYEMAFLMNPTKIEHVKEVASSFLVMPRKSTYFYPKILTGLVFNKIDPHEIIEVP